MANGQTLLDTMELINRELQLQTNEADVVRGLVALNRAQDYLESILAGEKWVKGDTTGTVVTDSGVETSTFPTGLLRLDRMVMISATTTRPEYELVPIRDTVVPSTGWPISAFGSNLVSPGKPTGYVTNGRLIYWDPVPNGSYTVRWYGLQTASDISAAGTFTYDDVAILPLASFACRLFDIGLDDDAGDVGTLAENTFRPLIKQMANFNRDGARGLRYRDYHGT